MHLGEGQPGLKAWLLFSTWGPSGFSLRLARLKIDSLMVFLFLGARHMAWRGGEGGRRGGGDQGQGIAAANDHQDTHMLQ